MMEKKNNCTTCPTCTRPRDSAACFECQASATDDSLFPMWRGEEDAFHAATEKFREMLDILPSTINHRLHKMLDELVKIYNAQKKPA